MAAMICGLFRQITKGPELVAIVLEMFKNTSSVESDLQFFSMHHWSDNLAANRLISMDSDEPHMITITPWAFL